MLTNDVETSVKDKLVECAEEFLTSLQHLGEDLSAKLNRLEIVRAIKSSSELMGEDGTDFFSDTDSISTASSLSGTSMSSSNFSW